MNEVISAYTGSESTLYAITDMACQSCLDNLDAFTNFNSQYTSEFVQSIIAAAADAKALPNSHQRQAVQTTLRKMVAEANDNLCITVLSLMQYIAKSFPDTQVDGMKKMAGYGYYKDAYNENWQASSTLFSMADAFLQGNIDALTTGGMPTSFPKDFETGMTAFADTLKRYNDYRNITENNTATKVAANNDIYVRLQSLMKDGKHIFRSDAAMQKQFSYAALQKKIGGHGKTGCRIVLQASESLQPITTATIYLQPGNHKLTANENGVYKAEVSAGTYSFTITAPGFGGIEGSLTINTGVMRHQKFVLTPAVVIAATA